MAIDVTAFSFSTLQEWLFDLQIAFPGNQHLIRCLQAEIGRREDLIPPLVLPEWEGGALPYWGCAPAAGLGLWPPALPGAFAVGPGDADAWGNTRGGGARRALARGRGDGAGAWGQDGSMGPVLTGGRQALAAPGRDGLAGPGPRMRAGSRWGIGEGSPQAALAAARTARAAPYLGVPRLLPHGCSPWPRL